MFTKKKLFSLFLAFAMVISCVSSVVSADVSGASVVKFNVLKNTALDSLDDATKYFSGPESGDIVESPVADSGYALQISSGKNVIVNKDFWPTGNKPKTISFDLKNTSGQGSFLLTDGNGNGIGNTVRNNDGALFSAIAKMSDNTISAGQGDVGNKFCGRNWVDQTDSVYAEIEPNENAHYEYEFSYSGTNVTVKLTVTGVCQFASTDETYSYNDITRNATLKNTATATRYFSNLTDITTLTPMFVTTGSMIVDNFSVTSYADYALEYLDSNELFSKNSDSAVAADADNSAAARQEYNALDGNVKSVLVAANGADVETFLDAVDAKIESLASVEKVSAYKNAYEAVINKEIKSMSNDDLITFAKAIDAYENLSATAKNNAEITALKATVDSKSDGVLAKIKTVRSLDFTSSKWIRNNYFAGTADVESADMDTFVTYKGDAEFASSDATPITYAEVTWQYPANVTTIGFYPVSGNSKYLNVRGDGSTVAGYPSWIADFGDNAKNFGSELMYTGSKTYANGIGLWNVSANQTNADWGKFEFYYDWSQFDSSEKLTVKIIATFTGKNVLETVGNTTDVKYDSEDGTYKSIAYTEYTLNDVAEPASVKFKLSSTGTINIKSIGVQSVKAEADEFNLKYSDITADSADFITAKATFEKFSAKTADLVDDSVKNVLSCEPESTFVSDNFADTEKSSVNWVGGILTPSFDRNSVNFSKKNTLTVSGKDSATLSEAVWKKGSKPSYMSITYSRWGNPYIIFAGDKNAAGNAGFGVLLEGVAHKMAILKDGKPAVLSNDFFIGSSVAYNENGTMNKALRSTAYNNTYWTTLDMAFDYSTVGKVSVVMDIYIYSNDAADRVIFSSVKRTYAVGDMTDFRPYFFANNGGLKVADFKYYTDEQLAADTAFINTGASIYLGDTAKGALSFTGTAAVKNSIAYNAVETANYAANIGKSVVINEEDISVNAESVDSLLPITEIGAKVWAKKTPAAEDIKTVSAQEKASTFGVVINGTNVEPTTSNASAVKIHTKLYVKIGDNTVESDEIAMSRNSALRKTAAYFVNAGKITGYTAEDALDSAKKTITDIKKDVYNCLGITA